MAARLDQLARGADTLRSILSDRPLDRVEHMRSAIGGFDSLAARLTSRNRLARELLRTGETALAISEFQALVSDVVGRVPPAEEARLRRYLAAAYLRLGEEENCQAGGNARACLLPIRGAGVHGRPLGSQEAARELLQVLRLAPEDVGARWLLNLAHMTLGDHPSAVPPEYLFDLETFGSLEGASSFENAASRAGLNVLGLSGGVVLDDLNGDDALDLMVSSWGLRDPLRVFLGDGRGSFDEVTKKAGLDGITGGLNLVHADYDNDGDVDILVLRGAWLGRHGAFPNSLLRNRGDATFVDVTEAAGLLSFRPTQTAAWVDYDGDGDLDLFVGNESSPGMAAPCELFSNNGDGTFTEVASDVGLDLVGFVKAVSWGDYDNDGRPDLFLSRLGQPNLLFKNLGPSNGGWRFVDVTTTAGVDEPEFSFPAWFWDYDNDGWLDLLVLPFPNFTSESLNSVIAGYLGDPSGGSTPSLYRNRGDGSFDDMSSTAGLEHNMLAMGANFGDLDNDGNLEFYVGTGEPDLSTLVPNRMYRSSGDGRFATATLSGGFGHLQKGHGIAWGDIDFDGDQDIYAVMGGAYPADVAYDALFVNPGNENRWITLELEGRAANRSAIGTRVRLSVKTPHGPRYIHTVVGSGGSFGASSLRQEIGLGRATAIERIEIDWAGSGSQVVTGADFDRHYRLVEGEELELLR